MNLSNEELGLIKTPKLTVDYMISRLGEIKNNEKLLEPCVGPGIFIKRLLKSHKMEPNQIFTYDINPIFKSKMKELGVRFEVKDTLLSVNQKDYNSFDYIIGNPPYLNKSSNYIRKNKDKLKEIYGNINAHETYAMFLVNSIWRLKEGGKLCFIVSDSFLTLRTHKKLREFILNNCKIEEILLAPKNLFLSQDVNTYPAILTLEKCTDKSKSNDKLENKMRIIPRIKSEKKYVKPSKINIYKQKKYHLLPFSLFPIDIEEEIINLFENAPPLKRYMEGFIGMHTHNNFKYIAAIEGTKLGDIFSRRNKRRNNPKRRYKIISRDKLNSEQWKPYLKRGGNDQYYRPILEGLKWDNDSINNYDIPKRAPFGTEGIVISGVSSRLAARYMPPGCYWDSNKAMGFIIKDERITIEYVLGLLNCSLYNYLAKGIINNTHSIQITGLRALPFLIPDKKTKKAIEEQVKRIINKKKENVNYDYSEEQEIIDDIIYEFYSKKYNFPTSLKKKLDSKFSMGTQN
ncbi:MAG: hypothetical protein EU547_01815 [Promethearchaeota archaeon]|nr:MAG: hypothetical protein EU547_01815 [Candidatus Lokiarchaeota archaeon]